MKRKWTLLLILVLIVSLLAMACDKDGEKEKEPAANGEAEDNGEEAGAEEGRELVIGVLSPTTGPEAYYGQDMLNAYTLAVKEINDAGGFDGYTFKLVPEDDACDAAQAATAAAKIISADPDFVVGGYCSGATIPALQQFYDAELVMLVSCANSTNITDLGLEQTFMINSPGTHGIQTLSKLAKSLDGVKKVATIHQGDDYTKNISDIAERDLPKDGFEFVGAEMMEKNTADISAIVTAIRNSGADLVYWCGYHADGSNAIKQLRSGGYEGYIVCGDGSSSPELITASGPAGEGVYVTSPPYVEFVEGGEEYIKKYEEMFGIGPGTYSTLCYDTIYLLKQAIEDTKSTDYETIRDAVQNIEYDGLSGLIKFADNRELAESNFIVLQIEDGAFKLIDVD
ncbi:MAG TPA: ABC transporter substrate-binding protein [Clostridiaceae bacterium]|nr:ABC transporter substrate-binding protein [Clostridiaceae bacterium]